MPEEPEEQKKEEEEKVEEKTETRPGKEKHKRLKQERVAEAQYKERLKDFKKNLVHRGKHLFDRQRKDKFLGGTKGRRGG
ncbi:MAG: hypothetical protein MUO91_05020 [candidate division Zixibacteria bacterium]|nr:hypothetical protein [candidate division Zixibacteria bacterium]